MREIASRLLLTFDCLTEIMSKRTERSQGTMNKRAVPQRMMPTSHGTHNKVSQVS